MSSIHIAILALSLSAPAESGATSPGDWPQWRGPNRDGVSAETGLLKSWPKEGPKLLWTFEKTGTGYSSFSVVGNVLYTMGALDEANGNREFVLAIDITTGKERWRTPIGSFYRNNWGGGPRSTPTVDGDHVYALGAQGDLVCLIAADGKKVWSKNLTTDFGGGVPHWGYSESVLIDGDRLVVTPGKAKGAMMALAKKSGDLVWRCEDLKDDAAYSSIIAADVGGVRHYVQQTMQGICGVRAEDGKLLWRIADSNYRVAVIPTPVFYKDHIFVTTGYGAGCKLIKLSKEGDEIKANVVYESKVITNHHGGVVRVGEYVYGHSDKDNQWVCLEFLKSTSRDGPEPAWTSKDLGKGSVSYADGHLFCYGERKGDVVMIKADPTDWQEVGRFTIPKTDPTRSRQGGVWPHPVIAQGKLFLRDTNFLFCYDLKGK
jgi:outer membrane protein assembly factor BamB